MSDFVGDDNVVHSTELKTCLICFDDTKNIVNSEICECKFNLCERCALKNKNNNSQKIQKCLYGCRCLTNTSENYYTNEARPLRWDDTDDTFLSKIMLFIVRKFSNSSENNYNGIYLILYIIFSTLVFIGVGIPFIMFMIMIKKDNTSLMMYNIIVPPFMFFMMLIGGFISTKMLFYTIV